MRQGHPVTAKCEPCCIDIVFWDLSDYANFKSFTDIILFVETDQYNTLVINAFYCSIVCDYAST